MQQLRSPIAVVLCLCLLGSSGPVLAQTPSAPHPPAARPAYQPGQLRGDERILHALNRFTFGPRPGDLDSVRAIGLEAWFTQQLNPDGFDQSDLNARLSQFPAMQWSTQDLLFRLPSNAVIRQTMNGRLPVPQGGVLHAVYQNQIDRLAARQQQQPRVPQQANPPAPAANSARNMAVDADAEKAENPAPMAKEPAPADSSMSMLSSGSVVAPPPVDPAYVQSILVLPPRQRVARLIAMRQPELDSFLKSLRPMQRPALLADLNPNQQEVVGALEDPQRLVTEELLAQRLTRDTYSSAQLQEVMTDFWLNHFNIYLHKNEAMPYYLAGYERDAIRPYALGRFEDLLEATAHSPAMLLYLDNASSIGPNSPAARRAKAAAWRRPDRQRKAPEGLNENYARELMELHTLGVNGGYAQADVVQVARILTGWTVDRPQLGGGFVFNPNRHEPGTEKVLGQKFKDRGEQQGRELLHFLAMRPATAQFLSRKLAERFVSDNPPQPLVDRMARSYLSSGGSIAAVLKTLFHSPEFWSAGAYRAKVKTPLEFVVSAVRSSNANITNLRPLANALRQMGMPLYGCVPPSGYSWQSSEWVSTGALVDRMNFALALAANRLPGMSVDWAPQSQDSAQTPTPESEEARLEPSLVPGGISISTRSALLQQFQQQSAQDAVRTANRPVSAQIKPIFRTQPASAAQRQDQFLAGLLLGAPEFQRR